MSSPIDVLAGELERARLVAIVRLVEHANVVEIATTLVQAGVRFLEITVERTQGFHSIELVVAALGDQVAIGAGTVLSISDVERVAGAGARFVVMPNTNLAVMAFAHERGLLALPGAFSPTEVAAAHGEGARLIKLFPASTGGVEHLRSLRGPFPNIAFVPTGGVTEDNAVQWLDAGAAAVAMGSSLVPSSGDLQGLAEKARRAVAVTSGWGPAPVR